MWGAFGTIIGSFLNVLILRYGKKPITGRSVCPSCKAVLEPYDLIPVLSWIFLRGRCRYCNAHISIQYPLVELGTGIAFALIGVAPIELMFKCLALPIASIFIAIAVHDLRTTIIPDTWVLLLGALSLVAAILSVSDGYGSYATVLLAGPLVALPLGGLWFFSRGTWMGFGDVKLALSIGWLLGIEGGLKALFLAFILGALVSVPLLVFSSEWWKRFRARLTPTAISQIAPWQFKMKSEIPFGPFLVAACFIVWFAGMYGITLPIADFGRLFEAS